MVIVPISSIPGLNNIRKICDVVVEDPYNDITSYEKLLKNQFCLSAAFNVLLKYNTLKCTFQLECKIPDFCDVFMVQVDIVYIHIFKVIIVYFKRFYNCYISVSSLFSVFTCM